MALYIEENQTSVEFVCEEQFNEAIRKFIDDRNVSEKPLWTHKRIEEAITAIEQFKLALELKVQRTHKQYYYSKKYDLMEVGTKKSLIVKRKCDFDPVVEIVPVEEFYHILRETHQLTGHGGRDKMLGSLKCKHFIPTSVVVEFLKLCTVCQSKRKFPKKETVGHPILASEYCHRGQVDVIDLQSTPDGNYKWLLHYQDLSTKFSFLRPLTSDGAAEVAIELLKIFLEVGCPHLLQSDNDREFTAAVIQELTTLWPTCKILNGRPTHPASQGSLERSNQDIEAMLRTWLIGSGTKNWALGCYFVQFQMNSSFHRTIQRSPYKALFGREPIMGLHFTHIPTELLEKLVTEEDLDQFLKQQQNDYTSTSEYILPTELINNNDSTSNKTPANELLNNNASTSEELSPAERTFLLPRESKTVHDSASASTSTALTTVSLVASEGDAANREGKTFCVVCGKESTKACLCDICKNPVHVFCVSTVEGNEYGSRILCRLCQNERNIKEQREHAAQNLERTIEKMKDSSSKKFKTC